eukprot:GHVU01133264.1.p1 GENE.GHVU01133264.1~~GHVU01133264.1.p1  ORF type:complete len:224 (+),score=25.56 GHVU01133264.1:81-674(+)
MSVHDTRLLSNPCYQTVLLQNLRYVIASLTQHSEKSTSHPAPLIRPAAIAEIQKETDQALDKLRELRPHQAPPRIEDKSLGTHEHTGERQDKKQTGVAPPEVPASVAKQSEQAISQGAETASEGGELWAAPAAKDTSTHTNTSLLRSQMNKHDSPDTPAPPILNFLSSSQTPPNRPEQQTQSTHILDRLLPPRSSQQ